MADVKTYDLVDLVCSYMKRLTVVPEDQWTPENLKKIIMRILMQDFFPNLSDPKTSTQLHSKKREFYNFKCYIKYKDQTTETFDLFLTIIGEYIVTFFFGLHTGSFEMVFPKSEFLMALIDLNEKFLRHMQEAIDDISSVIDIDSLNKK